MEIILDFLVDNYLWFLIISLILIFGLIGYIVDTREKSSPKLHFGNSEDLNESENILNEDKSLKELLEQNELDTEDNSEIQVNSNASLGLNDALNKAIEKEENELPKE